MPTTDTMYTTPYLLFYSLPPFLTRAGGKGKPLPPALPFPSSLPILSSLNPSLLPPSSLGAPL